MIQAVAATCSKGRPQTAGNGRHGAYGSLRDVADPTNVTRQRAILGPTVFFDQRYFEATNSVRHWTEPVALITLQDPTDTAYPTVMVYSPHGKLTRAELQRYVVALHPA